MRYEKLQFDKVILLIELSIKWRIKRVAFKSHANARIIRLSVFARNIYNYFFLIFIFPHQLREVDRLKSIRLNNVEGITWCVFIYPHVYLSRISNGRYTPYGVKKYASLNVTLEYKIEYACFYIVIRGSFRNDAK